MISNLSFINNFFFFFTQGEGGNLVVVKCPTEAECYLFTFAYSSTSELDLTQLFFCSLMLCIYGVGVYIDDYEISWNSGYNSHKYCGDQYYN